LPLDKPSVRLYNIANQGDNEMTINQIAKDMIEIARDDEYDNRIDMKNEACKRMHNFAVQYMLKSANAEKYPAAFKMVAMIENGCTWKELENWLINEWWK
jgi:hypothetical protein